jgi:HK97 gp10 family phage protein
MARAKFSNKARALKKLSGIPAAVRGEVRVAMAQNRFELEEAIRGAAPVRTGDLRDSVKSKDISTEDRIAYNVSAGDETAFYARMVEFGTPRQHAQPFFYPVYRSLRKRLLSRVSRAVSKGARKAAGSL